MQISVIIPVYNAASYLERSVNSVINQSFSQWELILVDDGSKDRSGQICDGFAQRDNRVRVIHQENAGAGAARNNGMALAKGDYVVFVDADDYIEPCYFEELSKHREDVVFIDVQHVDESGHVLKYEKMSSYKGNSMDDLIRSQMTGKMTWGGVFKAVKNQLVRDNNIRYSNHQIGEEALYSYQVLRCAKSVAFIDKSVYSYLQHGDSLSNSQQDDPWGEVAVSLRETIKSSGDYPRFADTLNAFVLSAAAVRANKVSEHYPLAKSIQVLEDVRLWMQGNLDKQYPIDYRHLSSKARLLAMLLKWHQYWAIWIISSLRNLVR